VGDTEHDLRSTVARKRSSMKAIVQDKYGSAEVLELRDIDKPEIGDGEVLARFGRQRSTRVTGRS
jgi:hypothetical protein